MPLRSLQNVYSVKAYVFCRNHRLRTLESLAWSFLPSSVSPASLSLLSPESWGRGGLRNTCSPHSAVEDQGRAPQDGLLQVQRDGGFLSRCWGRWKQLPGQGAEGRKGTGLQLSGVGSLTKRLSFLQQRVRVKQGLPGKAIRCSSAPRGKLSLHKAPRSSAQKGPSGWPPC